MSGVNLLDKQNIYIYVKGEDNWLKYRIYFPDYILWHIEVLLEFVRKGVELRNSISEFIRHSTPKKGTLIKM